MVSAILLLSRFLVTLVFATTGIPVRRQNGYYNNATSLLNYTTDLTTTWNRNEIKRDASIWHDDTKKKEALHHESRSVHFPAQLTLSAGMVGVPKKCCIPFDTDLGAAQKSL